MVKTINIIMFLVFGLFSCEAFAQNKFRVETINKTEYIIPPKSKLKMKGEDVKSGYQYHFIRVKDLTNNYPDSVEIVNNAEYHYDKKEDGGTGGAAFSSAANAFWVVQDEGNGFTVRIYYGAVVKKTAMENVEAFNILALDLLKYFSQREGDAGSGKWAPSISQNIVEKVFELIPVPQEASLARYGLIVTPYKSFVLISPKIWLLVDNVNKSYVELERDFTWQYNLGGQTLIQMNRDRAGGIIQAPFLVLSNRLSETSITSNSTLQASTADIQLSNALSVTKWVALYQEGFKRNNSIRADSPDGACANADLNNQKCNSELLLFKSASKEFFDCVELLKPTKRCINNPNIFSSTFGLRSLITPVINIKLNIDVRLVKLNSTLGYVVQTYDLPPPDKIKVYRKYRGSYKQLKGVNHNLILLPSDTIRYEL